MAESPLPSIPLDQLTPSRLWQQLESAEKTLAATAYYEEKSDETGLKRSADGLIARALRFREASVRKMPAGKKAGYMVRLIHPDDMMAASLLQALHLKHRRPLLACFLDALAIPHKDGLIDPEAKLEPPTLAQVEPAVAAVYGRFDRAEADTYFLSLVAMDRESWAALKEALAKRK